MRSIKPEPLTKEAFAPFGDVISAATAREIRNINYGNTTRFHDMAWVDALVGEGKPVVSLFRSKPLPRPVIAKIMERHPLGSQAFYPLSGEPYLVVVAPRGKFDAEKMRVFLAQPDQGVNYHAGTWHHYSLALNKECDFLVIDREGAPGDNCDEIELPESEQIEIDY